MVRSCRKCGVADALVIGYGNDLRGDDRAGRVVADRIEAAGLPGVTVRSQSQLTPELALDIARADTVVFVDADVECAQLSVRSVDARPRGSRVMSHHTDPETMLLLARDMGGLPREAHVVSIPATDLRLGLELSPRTQAAVAEAVDTVTALVAGS
jgi:hydrogenase maturation protease